MKQMKYLLTLLVVSICTVQSAWADNVVANVTLKEKNSLSTEILAIQGIDDIKTVTHLTVTTQPNVQLGELDWTTLQSMTALVELDLSNASATAIPNNQFRGHCPNLTTAFLPKDLTSIGTYAFYNLSNITTITVPNTVTSIGESAFGACYKLVTCDLSATSITSIPDACFNGCSKLTPFTIPSSVTAIGQSAFSSCSQFTSPLPTGLTYIGPNAFYQALMQDVDVVISEGMTVNSNVFDYSHIRSIEFPTTYYRFVDFYRHCSNLQSITLKSPTVVSNPTSFSYASNVTLKVPAHLVVAYKTHPEWSTYHDAVAIDPAVSNYTVSTDLDLSNSSMRMAGTPSVFFTENASFTISGSTAQAFNDFTASADIKQTNTMSSYRKYTKIFNEEATVTVNGDFKQRFLTNSNWNFLCLPFDFTVGNITVSRGTFVIRTYDGTRRNTSDTNTGNWSGNLGSDVVIKAGTGFILMTSKDETWVTIKAKAGGTNYAFLKNTDEIKINLAANNSNTGASAANTGWNMVGNPWQTYYNIHKLNYTAPFAVYNGYNYVTYSPADDDYALRPFEALFVQCPNGVTTIDFPATGRQMTSEVYSQNAIKKRAAGNRQLLDIQVADDEQTDKTRLVLNDDATMDYEIGRDASKFFADGTGVPQIYSIEADGTQYAINERPANNGTLKLGILFARDGEYTISAIRNDIGQVILTDNETGIKTNLQEHAYTFDANAGISNERFSLSFNSATGIRTMVNSETAEKEVYTLDGVKVNDSANGLQKGIYVVRQGKHTEKVIVK